MIQILLQLAFVSFKMLLPVENFLVSFFKLCFLIPSHSDYKMHFNIVFISFEKTWSYLDFKIDYIRIFY